MSALLFISVPPLFYLCALFLARAWFIAIMHIASFNNHQPLLEIFYPQRPHFYLALLTGVPALLTLVANRFPNRGHPVLNRWVKPIFIMSLFADMAIQLKSIVTLQLQYTFANAVLLTITIWLILWVFNSQTLTLCWKAENQAANNPFHLS